MKNSEEKKHKAGFVNIIGKPNAGKSTLMNQILGEKLSIITAKAQTTRHRIMGIASHPDFQIVYSDTPGIIEPKYALHKAMMRYVESALEDADVILWVTDILEKHNEEQVIEMLKRASSPIILLINKIDLVNKNAVEKKIEYWENQDFSKEIFSISALKGHNVAQVFAKVLEILPEHPPYFPEDTLTDRSERFFASEIIREKVFLNYSQEIPYATQINIEEFKEEEKIIRIRAELLVERNSQKGILIGKAGAALKKVGTQARKDLEAFFGKKVFLEQYVKVSADWRKNKHRLGAFGYNQ